MTLPVKSDRDAGESRRLEALRSFAVLDTPSEADFDDLTMLAAELCGTRIALVSLVDEDRQWFKSHHGFDACETPLAESFCVHALGSHDVLVIPDARLDPRVAGYRSVREAPYFRFYAGAPLIAANGEILGTLCVVDMEPRNLDAVQRKQLAILAAQVMTQLEIRRQAAQLAQTIHDMNDTKRMFDGVLKHTDVLIYAKDVGGRFVMVNRAVQEAARITEDMVGRTDYDYFDHDLADEYRRNDQRIMATGQRQVFTERIVHDDGSYRTYQSTKFPVYDDAGDVIGIAGVSTDVTDLEAARAAHEEAEVRLRTLVEHSPVAIIVVAETGMLTYVNPAAVALCGATDRTEIQGRRAVDLVALEEREKIAAVIESVLGGGSPMTTGRTRLLKVDDAQITVEFTVSRILYSGHPALQAEVRDITADLSDREQLEAIANTDALTGIMNRRAWTARVTSMTTGPAAITDGLVVAMLDLDHFKAYNDRYGHPSGDELLKEIAKVLQTNVRRCDAVARWGGEEFILALPGAANGLAAEILDRLKGAMPANQTCSIGYVAWADNEDNLASCIARADQALYDAKGAGRDRVVYR